MDRKLSTVKVHVFKKLCSYKACTVLLHNAQVYLISYTFININYIVISSNSMIVGFVVSTKDTEKV